MLLQNLLSGLALSVTEMIKGKEHLQMMIKFQIFRVKGKIMFDIITCNIDVYF